MTSETYLEGHEDDALVDLPALLAQPSVSATGEGIDACVSMVREYCLEYGFDTAEIVRTSGHPAVIAANVPSGLRTALSSISGVAFNNDPLCIIDGTPRATSTFSMPRHSSPRASAIVFP